jgi:hypothetical protein
MKARRIKTVEIRSGDSSWLYPLDSDILFQPLDENGTCLIEINNNTAKVISSNCPLKICISMGEISKWNQWIACLPHNVFISIIGKKNDEENSGLDGFVY